MDLGVSDLNPSSLIDLKAELHKKYDSFRRAKLDKSFNLSKPTPFKNKNKSDQNKDKKQKHVPVVEKKLENSEEDLALKKSRMALEAKAKLYEKIVSNQILIDDEQSDLYQVDFQRKVLYETPKPQKIIESKNVNSNSSCNSDPGETFITDAYQTKMYASSIAQNPSYVKPETIESDQPIHYQNVQFNEVRDHGVGYFAFSENEAKRKEQMEELNSLRQETESQRTAKQKQQMKRKAMIQARLAKICERKNIDQSVLDEYKTVPETENANTSETPGLDLSSIPLPEPEQETTKKEPKIRPWDIGKSELQHFVPEQKQKIKSQNDYIEERREERLSEFAPPSMYMSKK
ncbi:coiled-coil domain-containing protein 174 [Nephila pilipes]|uniref:Coiled-coil domain-containing protein 174 n=1 Tax=Nephila pilipes TaxID=299642 RepID=A0A8X6NQ22_NEPPI|nr:coiled-coil domain-containing protein 174 [Nephila pilipes]